MLALLKSNRDLRLIFFAQIVSFLGDWFTFVALAGMVNEYTGSKFLVSLVLVSESIPSFLMAPIAGPIVDRFDRRRVLIVVSCLQAIAACGLLFVGRDTIWLGFVCQSLIAGLAAFVMPAISAAIPNLARTPEELNKANVLFGSTWGVMLTAGAAIGGVFSAVFGRHAAFGADIATFIVAGLLFVGIKTKLQQHNVGSSSNRVRPIADMKEAIGLARHDVVIRSLIFSKTTFAIGAGIVSQLAVLSSDVFHSGDAGMGFLIAARGVGTGFGPILAMKAARGDLSRILFICGVSGMFFGLFYLGTAWSPHIVVAFIFVALAHLGGGAQWSTSTYGLQIQTPDELRGRVMAGDFAMVTLMLGLTGALSGLISDQIGVRPTISIFAIAALCASSAYMILTTPVRRALRTPKQPQ